MPPVESRKNCFPMCVVWCPLPMITWLFPPIGHVGIAYSDGLITDFLGSRFIHRGSLGFGAVARYWRLDPGKVADGAGGAQTFDTCVRRAESLFNTCEYYNLFGNNCHQYAAHAMNLAGYQGKRDWNMVHVAANVLIKGRWVSPWAAAKTWGPSAWRSSRARRRGRGVSSRDSHSRSRCSSRTFRLTRSGSRIRRGSCTRPRTASMRTRRER